MSEMGLNHMDASQDLSERNTEMAFKTLHCEMSELLLFMLIWFSRPITKKYTFFRHLWPINSEVEQADG